MELLQGCKNVSPKEFFAFLTKDSKGIVEGYLVVPLFYQAEDSVSYRTDTLPFDGSVVGTVHSHPSLHGSPSRADLNSFSKRGSVHLIIAYPYNFDSIYAYSSEGKPMDLELVD